MLRKIKDLFGGRRPPTVIHPPPKPKPIAVTAPGMFKPRGADDDPGEIELLASGPCRASEKDADHVVALRILVKIDLDKEQGQNHRFEVEVSRVGGPVLRTVPIIVPTITREVQLLVVDNARGDGEPRSYAVTVSPPKTLAVMFAASIEMTSDQAT